MEIRFFNKNIFFTISFSFLLTLGIKAQVKTLEAPGSYEILKKDKEPIEIPFNMYAGNKPMIIGKMNGKDVKFLIDNGKLFDEIWFYNGEVDSLGLRYQSQDADSLIGIGANNASAIYDGNSVEVDFKHVRFIDQPTLISPSEAGYASFFPGINGQVSSMLFKHFIVKFDFENNIITLIEPQNFKPAKNQNAVLMHKRSNGSYCIPFELVTKAKDVYDVLLDIDIGTVFPLYLISNGKNNLPIPSDAPKNFLGVGASGELYGYSDTLKQLRFGNYVLENYPTLTVKEESNADTSIVESGTFGVELMKQFTVTFDYINEIIYFEPNSSFKGKVLKDK
jgi:sporulation protein YlmC with PRC-barrel domain